MKYECLDKETREIFQQETLYTHFPFAELRKVKQIVCPDGSRRMFTATSSADTFFSIPGYVQVNGTSVRGYATTDSIWDDETNREWVVWLFKPYTYCKNWRMVMPPYNGKGN
jgi:hypothetical protein